MQAAQLPYFVQIVQALGPTAVAIAVGSLAGYIAWRQWKTAQHRLRLDMFDRRFAIYEATKLLFGKVPLHGQITSDDLREFYRSMKGAEFLFDGETREYFKRIGELCWQAQMARHRQGRLNEGVALDKLIDEEDKILTFLQYEGPNLEKIVSRYLDLSKAGL